VKYFTILLFVLLIATKTLFAVGSGKISGIVKDAKTNEPLFGANIVLMNTNLGAATDINGFYSIIGIPPGNYDVKISSIGYQSKIVTDVKIVGDLTTDLSLSLLSQTIELDEEVVIVAEKPVVQKDLTSTRVIVDGQIIVDELRAQNLSNILNLQPGVTFGTDGSFHVRGGRAGGSVIQVDGIPMLNPFLRSSAGQIDVESIQEFQALLGTFNAEYGNASDGIINISTKDGGNKYSVKVLYESPQLNASPYHEKDWNLNRSDIKSLSPEEQEKYKDLVRKPDGTSAYDFVSVLDDKYVQDEILIKTLGTFVANVSGPVPFVSGLSFFTTGRLRTENSQLPWGYDIYKSFTGKLTYFLTPESQLRFTYSTTKNTNQDYNHQYKYWRWWDSGLDTLGRQGSYPVNTDLSDRQILNFKQVLSNSSFFDLTIGRVYDYDDDIVPERTVTFDPNTGEMIESDYFRRYYVNGNDSEFRYGDVRYWLRTENTQFIAKANYENQITNHHLIKTGFDIKRHEIFRHRIGMPTLPNLQFFKFKPFEISAYIQDKVEYSFMILNLGLRLDYFDPDATAYPDQSNILEVFTDDTGTAIYRTAEREQVKPHIQLSPRIGLAHPISDMTSIYFAYGHFFQIPRFYDLYRNNDLNDILRNDALIGNPSLKPEKTVSFEVGLQQQIMDDWGLNLTAYTKDISNLISSQYYFVGRDYSTFINADFGTVRGIDLTLDKKFTDYYSFRLTYSLMSAMGNASDPLEGYNSYREDDAHLRPNRNYPLDFDQTHKLVSFLTVRLPKGFAGPIFELMSFNTVFTVNSGLPYTPTSRDADESDIVPEPNSGRRPWTYNLDFRMSKEISLDMFNLTMYLNIENVLDTENTRFIWSRTGEALSEGPTSIRSFDRQANPANLSARRSVKLGVYLHF
jgi:outer membrane receptor protein involved in Fe transport